jgi:nitroreductase
MEDCAPMELREALRRRAMVRSFSSDGVDPRVVDRLIDDALRSPTAGNTGGTAWVILEGPEETATYWDATTDEEWRGTARRWEGLQRAPVVLLAYTSPGAYVARYAEPDKAAAGLGVDEAAWPVPYWFGDAAFSIMAVLLGAVDAGLGACLLGVFRGEEALARIMGVPDGWRQFGAVVLGHPDGRDHRSPSLDRPRPRNSERVHRGRW